MTFPAIQPVIMSGGSGTRLWPLSRRSLPKQFLPLISERSMFQETVMRLSSPSPAFQGRMLEPIVAASAGHRALIERQLEAVGIRAHALILEPFGRNTAPVAALAGLATAARDRAAIILLLPADHHIEGQDQFEATVLHAAAAAERGYLATFGMAATRPETGYGYIRRGTPLWGLPDVFQVAEFVEKPQRAVAERYVQSGDHYWNGGIFAFGCDSLETEFQRWRPDIWRSAKAAYEDAERVGHVLTLRAESFGRCEAESIDYAIMEKTDRACVVPAHFTWNDIGSWHALWDVGVKDAAENVASGDTLLASSRRNYARSEERLMVLLGVDDLVVVDSPDAVLIAHRERVQDVKSIVETLQRAGRPETCDYMRGASEASRLVWQDGPRGLTVFNLAPGSQREISEAGSRRLLCVCKGVIEVMGRPLMTGATKVLEAHTRFTIINHAATVAAFTLLDLPTAVDPGRT